MSVLARMVTPRGKLAGFTLLEVMIAVVILAVGLSSLFTSEAGAIRIAQRARTTTVATLLARCKMAEIEEKIGKEGWPGDLLEGNDECCEDGTHDGYKCDWKVEKIKLPDKKLDEDDKDDDDKDKSPFGSAGVKSGTGLNSGILDTISGLSKAEPGAKMSGITDFLSGSGSSVSESAGRDNPDKDAKNPEGKDRPNKSQSIAGTELDPMASMVMGFAFPMLKPVIEAGTRRASVIVRWKEGANDHQFEVVQFMVSEQQIILPDVDDDDGGVSATSNTGAAATSATTPAATTPAATSTTGATK